MITHHTELLNALIEKYNLKSYLEIGVQNPANNFDKINLIIKNGVDPEYKGNNHRIFKITSDEYFKLDPVDTTFDIIFIDGLHHSDQVKRDFENSLRCLSDNGFIVIHDVLPENESGTIVPRETKVWWGDVYKWAMSICEYDGIEYKTFDIDNGCMVINKNSKNKGKPARIKKGNSEYSFDFNWDSYNLIGRQLMNVQYEVAI